MPAIKFFRPGITRVYALPPITAYTELTAALLAAAEDVSCDIAEMSGWTFTGETIETPTICDSFVSKVPGLDKAEDSSLTCYEKRDTADPAGANPLRALWAKGELGTIVVFPMGLIGAAPAIGDVCDAFKVQSTGTPREFDSGQAARWMANFALLERPAIDYEIAA